MSNIYLRRVSGSALAPYLPAVARLRIEVFREFPYLYDGSLSYEEQYLETYRRCPESVVVLAMDGERIVGASTAIPMKAEEAAFRAPFEARGYDPDHIFYLAESVLLPSYRGQGLGVRFFEEREAHAQSLGGFAHFAFCAVQRPASHPARPADYLPLDRFWQNRGYRQVPALQTQYRWKDVGEAQETLKTMVFWVKSATLPGQ